LWIIAILLAVIATTLLTKRDGSFAMPSAFADGPAMVGGKGVFAFMGPLDKSRSGLWMMDVDNQTVWCYEYLPATRKLKLVAARSYESDRYLKSYETDEPTVEQVQEMLLKEQEIQNRIKKNTPHVSNAAPEAAPEEDALGTSIPGIYEPETTQDGDGN
jgi:hypothetical protein